MFASRKASEEQALSYTQIRNRMSAATLSDLLDARKDIKTQAELQTLAKTFAIDLDLLNILAKNVNSPSVGERTTTRAVENGEEKVTTKVSHSNWRSRVWVLMVPPIRVTGSLGESTTLTSASLAKVY